MNAQRTSALMLGAWPCCSHTPLDCNRGWRPSRAPPATMALPAPAALPPPPSAAQAALPHMGPGSTIINNGSGGLLAPAAHMHCRLRTTSCHVVPRPIISGPAIRGSGCRCNTCPPTCAAVHPGALLPYLAQSPRTRATQSCWTTPPPRLGPWLRLATCPLLVLWCCAEPLLCQHLAGEPQQPTSMLVCADHHSSHNMVSSAATQ